MVLSSDNTLFFGKFNEYWAIEPSKIQPFTDIQQFLGRSLKDEKMTSQMSSYGIGGGGSLTIPYEVINGVASVDIYGPIYPVGFVSRYGSFIDPRILASTFEKMKTDEAVKRVRINVDSGGGSAFYINEAMQALKKLTVEKYTEVIVYDLCCSAAYWIASAARKIVALEAAEIGSIGVLLVRWDYTEYFEKQGDKAYVITSGRRKADSYSISKMTEEVLKAKQHKVDQLAEMFIASVAENRGLEPEKVKALDADCFFAKDAIKNGLIDQIINIEGIGGKMEESKGYQGQTDRDPKPSNKGHDQQLAGVDQQLDREPKPSNQGHDQQLAGVDQQLDREPKPSNQGHDQQLSGSQNAMNAEEIKAFYERSSHAGMTLEQANELLQADMTLEEATDNIFLFLKQGQTPVRRSQLTVDAIDKYSAAVTDALCMSAGVQIEKPAPGANDFLHFSMMGIIDEGLRAQNRYSRSDTEYQRIEKAMNVGGHSTSDFPVLLGNVVNRTLLSQYEIARPDFMKLAKEMLSRDFKANYAIKISDTPDLLPTDEHGEYQEAALKESAESWKVEKRGRKITLTFEMIVNDSLGGFLTIPSSFAISSRRMESTMFWGLVRSNPTMSDGNKLFSEAHHNIATGANIGVVTTQNLSDARASMRNQRTDSGKDYLNLVPRYIAIPSEQETNIDVLLLSPGNTEDNKNANVNNPFYNKMESIVEPSLAEISKKSSVLFADPRIAPAFVYSYLRGHKNPYVVREKYTGKDGISFRVRHIFGCGVVCHKPVYFNPGNA